MGIHVGNKGLEPGFSQLFMGFHWGYKWIEMVIFSEIFDGNIMG